MRAFLRGLFFQRRIRTFVNMQVEVQVEMRVQVYGKLMEMNALSKENAEKTPRQY